MQTITAQRGFVVLDGPFEGMKLLPDDTTFGEEQVSIGMLLGSYEVELHNTIERLARKDYARIVNIGSGAGYYAVGLALKLPNSVVYASEASPYLRKLCKTTAALNSVSGRVHVMGATANLQDLGGLLGTGNRTLLLIDCEGCEYKLLHPDLVPALKKCELIVELHDSAAPSASVDIPQRFAESHEIEFVNSVERTPNRYSVLKALEEEERKMAVNELRAPTHWAVMSPR